MNKVPTSEILRLYALDAAINYSDHKNADSQ